MFNSNQNLKTATSKTPRLSWLKSWTFLFGLVVLCVVSSCGETAVQPTADFECKSAVVDGVVVSLVGKDTLEVESRRPVAIFNFTSGLATSSASNTNFTLTELSSGKTLLLATSLSNANASVQLAPATDLTPAKVYKLSILSQKIRGSAGQLLALPMADVYVRLKSAKSPPSPVKDITKTNEEERSIVLTWTHDDKFGTDALGKALSAASLSYAVWIDTNASGKFVSLPSVPATTSKTATCSGLASDRLYSFKVLSINIAGDTTWSEAIAFRTKSAAQAPAKVVLSQNLASQGSIHLSWAVPNFGKKSDGSASSAGKPAYKVLGYSESKTGAFGSQRMASDIEQRTIEVSGLEKGKTYYFVVQAINSEGLTSSDTIGFQTSLAVPPTKPVLSLVAGAAAGLTKTTANLTVTPDYSQSANIGINERGNKTGVTFDQLTYSCRVKGAAAYSAPQILTAGANQRATLTDLIPNTTYEVKAVVSNSVVLGNGSTVKLKDSTINEVNTNSALSAPANKKTISKISSSANTLTVTWTAPTDSGRNADGTRATLALNESGGTPYAVFYGEKGTNSYVSTNLSVTQSTRTAVISSLDKTKEYVVIVRATNSAGEFSSDTSAGFQLDLSASPTKPAFTLMSPRVAGSVTASLTLTSDVDYTASANVGKLSDGTDAGMSALQYFHKPKTGGAYGAGEALGRANHSSATISGLTPNTAYTVKVKVTNSAGLSDSLEKEVTTASALSAPATGKVISKQSTGTTSSQLSITWTAPSDFGRKADGTIALAASTPYTVSYATSRTGTYTQATTIDQTNRTATITGLSRANTYWISVQATNDVGENSADTSAGLQLDLSAAPMVSTPTAGTPTSHTVNLTWSSMSGRFGKNPEGVTATGRALYVQQSLTGMDWTRSTTGLTGGIADTSATSTMVSDLLANKTYQFRLVAKNNNSLGNSDSAVGGTVSATTSKIVLTEANYPTTRQTTFAGTPVSSDAVVLSPSGASATYRITSPSTLPSGISIDANTGKITANASIAPGTYDFSVTAEGSGDYMGSITTLKDTIVVTALRVGTITYSPTSISVIYGSTGAATATKSTSGATVEYSIQSGGVTGMSIDASTGTITTNTTLNAGTYTIQVKAKGTGNYAGDSTLLDYTVIVNKKPISPITAPMAKTLNYRVSDTTLAATIPLGETDSLVLTSAVPSGITMRHFISGALNIASGTPAGSYTMAVIAYGTGNYTGTQTADYTVTVNAIAIDTFSYNTDSKTAVYSKADSSVLPTTNSALSATYSVSSTPSHAGIAVDALGRLQFAGTIGVGTYTITVTATAKPSTNYKDSKTATYTLSVVPDTLKSLNYATAKQATMVGTAVSSVATTLSPSGATATYTISSVTKDGGTTPVTIEGISIHPSTGVITASSTTPTGKYRVNVSALGTGNYSGTVTTSDSIYVNGKSVGRMYYIPATLTTTQGIGSISASPTFTGGNAATVDDVEFSISPETMGINIEADGKVTVLSTLNAGTYNLTVQAKGKGEFTDSSTVAFTVTSVDDRKIQELLGNSADTKRTVSLTGKVIDEQGNLLSGAEVSFGTETMTTDASGLFTFSGVDVNQGYTLVKAEKSGYFNASSTFVASDSSNIVTLTMVKQVEVSNFSTEQPSQVTTSENVTLDFPAYAIVTQEGNNYTGTVSISTDYVNPSDANASQLIPGNLIALSNDANIESLTTTYGMVSVNLTDNAGNPVQVKPGTTVELRLPYTAGGPDTIGLWHFSESLGVWTEQGKAIKVGNEYVGQVSHFSVWVLGTSAPCIPMPIAMQLKDNSGNLLTNHPIYYGTVDRKVLTYTDAQGKMTVLYSSCSNTLKIRVYQDNGQPTGNYEEFDVNPQTVNIVNPTILYMAQTNGYKVINLSGGVVDCDENPIPDIPISFVVRDKNNTKDVGIVNATTNALGYFSANANFSPNSTNTYEVEFIYAYNGLRMGGKRDIDITQTKIDIGTSIACEARKTEVLPPPPYRDDFIIPETYAITNGDQLAIGLANTKGTLSYERVKNIKNLRIEVLRKGILGGFDMERDVVNLKYFTSLKKLTYTCKDDDRGIYATLPNILLDSNVALDTLIISGVGTNLLRIWENYFLTKTKHLILDNIVTHHSLEGIGNFKSLISLTVRTSKYLLQSMDDIKNCTNLTSVDFSDTEVFRDFKALQAIPNLTSLSITNARNARLNIEIASLAQFPKLTYLNLANSQIDIDMSGTDPYSFLYSLAPQLTYLNLSGVYQMVEEKGWYEITFKKPGVWKQVPLSDTQKQTLREKFGTVLHL